MIQVENITKKYGSFTAVNDISFEIEEGEIVGFLGPNGAGKSTTMNMITGFIEPTSGKIIVDGYNISKKPKKAKRQIGYMPEGVPLYTDLTVKEFVTYMAELKGVPKKERKEKVEKALEDTGLIDVKNKLTRNLSRGYKQRVSMAGALVSNPKVIIAIDTPENLEKKVVRDNTVYVTVEDPENKMDSVKDKLENVQEIKLIEENEDKTKKYKITADDGVDLRKNIFDTFAKEEITIFEMKKSDVTLEDAFIQLINSQDENAEEQEKQLADEADENEENKAEENETEESETEENEVEEKETEENAVTEDEESKEEEKEDVESSEEENKEEKKDEGGQE